VIVVDGTPIHLAGSAEPSLEFGDGRAAMNVDIGRQMPAQEDILTN
jgi:hypothetical protein